MRVVTLLVGAEVGWVLAGIVSFARAGRRMFHGKPSANGVHSMFHGKPDAE